MSVSVCLCVCLLTYLKNRASKLHQVLQARCLLLDHRLAALWTTFRLLNAQNVERLVELTYRGQHRCGNAVRFCDFICCQ